MSPKNISKSYLERLIESQKKDGEKDVVDKPLPTKVIEDYPILFDQTTKPLTTKFIYNPILRYSHEHELSKRTIEFLFPEGKYTREMLDLRTNPLNFFRIIDPGLLEELRKADYDGLSAFLPDEVLKCIDIKITPALEASLLLFNSLFPGKQKISEEDLQDAVTYINVNGIEKIAHTTVGKLKKVNPHSLTRYFEEDFISAVYRQIGVDYIPTTKKF